jgi:integrase
VKAKLRAGTVGALKPGARPYEVRDTDIRGFLLRVQPSGAMAYYLAYDTLEGKRARYRIGRAGNLTPAQARDIALRLAADVAHGRDIHAAKKAARLEAERAKRRALGVFLEEAFEPWFEAHQSRTTGTVRKVKTAFAELLAKPMTDITPWWLEKWRTERRKAGILPSTLNREVAALKAVLSKAVQWGVLPDTPLPRGKLKPLKIDTQSKVRYLSEAEEKWLRETLDAREARIRAGRTSANDWRRQRGYPPLPTLWDHECADHLKPMVLLSLNTGLRRGEMFKLTWANVNFHAKTITVEGKTAKSGTTRHIPTNAEALEVLRRWNTQGSGTGFVFAGKDGCPMDNVQSSWERLIKDARLCGFRWHDLRHSFASKLVMAGVDLNTVRELLGHSDIKMTLRYAHLAPEHKHAAVARLVSTV